VRRSSDTDASVTSQSLSPRDSMRPRDASSASGEDHDEPVAVERVELDRARTSIAICSRGLSQP
jgi:hypothetical protein